jgi:hypothetical protein
VRTMDALEWKAFYARERRELGSAGLQALVSSAPDIGLSRRGAIVFPHTRLRVSGALVAAAAKAAVECSADEVLALGVLHGGRRADAENVTLARSGDANARALLRRVHGPGVRDDGGHWTEEFSLDNFEALVEVAARMRGRRAPRIVKRFPFLVGATPDDLPGTDELSALRDGGALLVATADPLHHGAGYGTPPSEVRDLDDPKTEAFARSVVEEGLALLARHAYVEFSAHAEKHRSDFRDVGPALAALLPSPFSFEVRAMTLVDYSAILNAAPPTWVAGPLTVVRAPT